MSPRHLSDKAGHPPGEMAHKVCFQESTAVMATSAAPEKVAELFTNEQLSRLRTSVWKHHWKARQRQMSFIFPLFSKASRKLSFVPLHCYATLEQGISKQLCSHSRKLFWIMLCVGEAKEPQRFLLIITSSCGLPSTARRQVSVLSN